MSTRLIVKGLDMIKKVVPSFDEIDGKKFPTLGELNDWDTARERIYELLDGTNFLCQSAVVQQYNEYIIWNSWANCNKVLAPINFISTDERNIPILGFRYFEPVVKDSDFYKYNDNESLLKLGVFAAEHNISFEEVRKFFKDVEDCCLEFNLNEDDIYYNLSNIGYNSDLGLRVIDYGLVESSSDKKFELVM